MNKSGKHLTVVKIKTRKVLGAHGLYHREMFKVPTQENIMLEFFLFFIPPEGFFTMTINDL